jgi:Tfp pilus assembly protein PilO
MQNNLKPKMDYPNKIALSILVFLLAAGCLIYFLIMPAAEKVKEIKASLENQRLEVEKNYLAGKSLKKLTQDLKTVEPGLNELQQSFIKKSEAMKFITLLEQMADKNNVMEKVALGAESELGKSFIRIPAQSEVRGDFTGEMGYLSDLESVNYYLNIKSLEISAVNSDQVAAGGAKENLIMQIAADSYWQN